MRKVGVWEPDSPGLNLESHILAPSLLGCLSLMPNHGPQFSHLSDGAKQRDVTTAG